jgi:hypothetical protein
MVFMGRGRRQFLTSRARLLLSRQEKKLRTIGNEVAVEPHEQRQMFVKFVVINLRAGQGAKTQRGACKTEFPHAEFRCPEALTSIRDKDTLTLYFSIRGGWRETMYGLGQSAQTAQQDFGAGESHRQDD